MNRLHAGLRLLRKPAVALVAVAGLAAWGAGGASLAPAPPAGIDALAVLDAPSTPALAGGGHATGLFGGSGEGTGPRSGADPGSAGARAAAGVVRLPPSSSASAAAPVPFLAHARCGLEAAPATGPPTVPS